MTIKSYSILLGAALLMGSCGKNFLEKKRDEKLVIPKTIQDYQSLLDNTSVMNSGNAMNHLALSSADEFNASDKTFNTYKGALPYQTNAHIWEKEIYERKEGMDWNQAYHRIMIANLALEVSKLNPANAAEKLALDNTRGSALFFRAYSFYYLAQQFCQPYNAATASSDPGVPLKDDYDITVKLPRGNVAQVYDFIIKDLKEAIGLLPDKQEFVTRPGKAAAAALLAKTYLQMNNYEKVFEYAEMAMKINGTITKFRLPDMGKNPLYPSDYGKSNPEVLFHAQSIRPGLALVESNVTPEVMDLFEPGDLRKTGFFLTDIKGFVTFKGSPASGINAFTGITTTEVLLMRAEAYARLNQTDQAMADLNLLRSMRFDDTFQPLTASNATEAIKLIIRERRMELYSRGTRWEDLRRLNRDPQFASTLTRMINGAKYTLEPNSPRYTFPLPDNEIEANNYTQNPR
ncbi:RagB/SusD family nutrient uptake outer membrane protein [Pseudoflavitalea sp. G-6-1-2]|uniref:RagB/SusD family nutrient uptake outer membrane protein n=1 Tax=Pseudoflavitalea sp. G-6-1-2 TaxID=2728841 RepID=UPI00146E75F7|nr:RagB/SusD family nutrient uptake outer membrane protein [Pseudoflavitalea sp. G-6-1-2]NML23855.1 RagB/SusD family nutrient uptake outer membrane protein [Pseudoflavitalea sp. G-6-1-2]